MKPQQLIEDLINGAAGYTELKQAARRLNGLQFWAIEIEAMPGRYDVEIRRTNGAFVERREMSREELEAFKPKCAYWIITAAENPEFVHAGNRDQYPY